MIVLSYERLMRITETEKPFRGNANRFPIGNRKHNTKCFYRRTEGEQVVFDVTYGYKYERKDLMAEEYEALSLAGADNIRKMGKWDYKTGKHSETDFEYWTFNNTPNVLGTVRPDNTFEFNASDYHQGERQVMSSWSKGYFINDSRRGGLIYKSGFRHEATLIPIWNGLRVDCATMQPKQDYQVFTKQVDRKVSKQLMSPYKDFYQTVEVMMKAMDWSTFIQVCGDVHTQYREGDPDHKAFNRYGAIAEQVMNESPIDAAVLFMMQMDIGQVRWDTVNYVRNGNVRTSRSHESPEELFINMKRGINKFLYRAHQETFKRIEQEAGKKYPAGDWGVEVIVNGEKVVQYGYGL
jgi:hypothetical protein